MVKEKDIQRAIMEYLALNRIFHYRQNSGAFKRDDGHFYRFGANGAPDIVAVVNGQYVGIEVKRKGSKQNENQKMFQQELEKAGGKYILAYSLDEIIACMKLLGKLTT